MHTASLEKGRVSRQSLRSDAVTSRGKQQQDPRAPTGLEAEVATRGPCGVSSSGPHRGAGGEDGEPWLIT